MTTSELVMMILLSIILPLIGWMLSKINTMSHAIVDLWEWHRPDHEGRQAWKNADLQRAIGEMVV